VVAFLFFAPKMYNTGGCQFRNAEGRRDLGFWV
jgi:hypothetical protein